MNYFSALELRCKCNRKECDAEAVSLKALAKLNSLRSLLGRPIDLSSARRCVWHNENIKPKGSPVSQHLRGKAFDISEPDRKKQAEIAELAEKIGFGGIFFYDWGVHVDDGPPNRRGSYRTK